MSIAVIAGNLAFSPFLDVPLTKVSGPPSPGLLIWPLESGTIVPQVVPLSTCQDPSYGRVCGTGQKEHRLRIGYARVSTPDQSDALQRDALEHSGCTKVFHEIASGAKTARPALAAALEYLRPGDILVVWRLDRLGRSLGQLMALMQTLQSREVGFHSLVEAIDTTTVTGQFFFQITGAFAELERNLIRERTRAGLASARQRGRCGGRPKAIDAETFAMAVQLYQAQTISVQSICTRLGIARRTFYRYLAARSSERSEE